MNPPTTAGPTSTSPAPPLPSSAQLRTAWDAVADGFDRHVTPHTLEVGEQLVARLGVTAGTRMLDVGAGTGAVSIPAARTGADVLAVDISPRMVALLAERAAAAGLDTLRAVPGDALALPLDDDHVDVSVSLNGVSTIPDLAGGTAEMVRVTRRGGTVALAAFGPLPEVEFVAFFLAALRAVVPDRIPGPDRPLPPFRLADPDRLRAVLVEAGLQEVTVEQLTWATTFANVNDLLAAMLASNPIAGQLTGGLDDDDWAQVRGVLEGMLRERAGERSGAVLRTRINVGRGRP